MKKLKLAHGRFIFGATGIESISSGPEKPWDFNEFCRHIDPRISDSDAVSKVADLVRAELAKLFTGFDVVLQSGAITRGMLGAHPDDLLNFFVAGYESGRPIVLVVKLAINWEQRHLEDPAIVHFFPGVCQRVNVSVCGIAPDDISSALNPATPYFKWSICRSPELPDVVNDVGLSLDQSVRVARAMVDVGAQFDSDTVGLPATVITMPAFGANDTKVYTKGLPDLCANIRDKKEEPKK